MIEVAAQTGVPSTPTVTPTPTTSPFASSGLPSSTPSATPLAVTNPNGPKADPEMSRLINHARSLANFAGLWIAPNQQDVHVAVVGDLAAAAAELLPDVSPDMTLFIHPAEFTYAELRKLEERITDDGQILSADGITISVVAVDERANRVSVGIDPLNEATTAEMSDRYGEAVALESMPVGHVPVATWPVDSETLTAAAGAQPDLVNCSNGPGFPSALFDDPSYPDAPAGLQRVALDDGIKVFGVGFGLDGSNTGNSRPKPDDTVIYVTKVGGVRWISAGVHFADGAWGPAGMGDCRPMTAFPDGLGPATWALDPSFPVPTADSTELHILVWELACSSGSPATGRMSSPIATYSDSALVMIISVTPVGGVATCPGPPGTPAMVVLPQSLGHRTLLDGSSHPPMPPKGDL